MTHSKKQQITENNEKHSNWPTGRCSGPLLDIFGSTEPWAHALLPTFQRKKLNLNILGSKIEICAQNSAFLRKKSPHITQKISEPKQPTDDRTTWPRSPWVVLTTCQKAKKIDRTNVAQLREPANSGSYPKSDCGGTVLDPTGRPLGPNGCDSVGAEWSNAGVLSKHRHLSVGSTAIE